MEHGAIVKYQGELFYLQPFGSHCHLYHRASEVGRPYLAVYRDVSQQQVLTPTIIELRRFVANVQ